MGYLGGRGVGRDMVRVDIEGAGGGQERERYL